MARCISIKFHFLPLLVQFVSQMALGVFKYITNGTLVFKSYHKWYLFTQSYLFKFRMHVLHTK